MKPMPMEVALAGALMAAYECDQVHDLVAQGISFELFRPVPTLAKKLKFIIEHRNAHGAVPTVPVFTSEFGLPMTWHPDAEPYRHEPVSWWAQAVRNSHATTLLRDSQRVTEKHLSDGDVSEALAVHQQVLATVYELVVPTGDLLAGSDEAKRRLLSKHARRASGGGVDGYDWGYDFLNRATGGLHAGEVHAIAARQKTGKTWLATILANKQREQGRSVLFITREMDADQILDRLVALVGKFPYADYKEGKVGEEALKTAIAELEDGAPVNITQPPGGVQAVAAKVLQYAPEVVFVDGVYLLEDDLGAHAGWEKIQHIVYDLLRMAQRLRVPVVITTQLNRVEDAEKADSRGLAFGDSLGMACHSVLTMFQTQEMREDRLMGLKHMLVREGEPGNAKLSWSFKTMDFKEVLEVAAEDDEPTF